MEMVKTNTKGAEWVLCLPRVDDSANHIKRVRSHPYRIQLSGDINQAHQNLLFQLYQIHTEENSEET